MVMRQSLTHLLRLHSDHNFTWHELALQLAFHPSF